MPNITKAEFTNTVVPDEMADYELSHLDLQCLPFRFFQGISSVIRSEISFYGDAPAEP